MRKTLATVAIVMFTALIATTLSPRPAGAEGARTTAVSIAVGRDDGTLLLRTDAGFSLVVVDPSLPIEGRTGQRIALHAIQPGDRVEYTVEPWAGASIVTFMRVIPVVVSGSRP